MQKKIKRPKYNNKKVHADGYVFDSKDEYILYQLLKKQKEEGLVESFTLHPKFEIQPKFSYMGVNYQKITYSADFDIQYYDRHRLVIDVKGTASEQAVLRRKMFMYKYPDIELIWISRNKKYGDENGWIDYDALQKIRRKNKKEKANEDT